MTQNQLMIPIRRLTAGLSIAVLSILAISGCSDSKSTDNNGGFEPKFRPQVAEIVVGDTIRWTVVSGDHELKSGTPAGPSPGSLFDQVLHPGESFSYVFDTKGSYSYYCSVHEDQLEAGTVHVSDVTTKVENVSASGSSFSPANVTIEVGDAVKWNVSGSHTITSGTGSGAANAGLDFDEARSSGQSYQHTFTTAGSFPYFCRLHESAGMKGTVTVTERTNKTVDVQESI